MNESGRIAARYAIGCATLAAAVLGAGCDRAPDVPVYRYDVRLEADARSPKQCSETAGVAFEPVAIAPQVQSNMYQTTAFSYTANIQGKPVEDGPKNFECWYDYHSPALSPGKWKITGEFTDGSKSCIREVGGNAPAGVAIDQEQGCVEPLKAGASGEMGISKAQ